MRARAVLLGEINGHPHDVNERRPLPVTVIRGDPMAVSRVFPLARGARCAQSGDSGERESDGNDSGEDVLERVH